VSKTPTSTSATTAEDLIGNPFLRERQKTLREEFQIYADNLTSYYSESENIFNFSSNSSEYFDFRKTVIEGPVQKIVPKNIANIENNNDLTKNENIPREKIIEKPPETHNGHETNQILIENFGNQIQKQSIVLKRMERQIDLQTENPNLNSTIGYETRPPLFEKTTTSLIPIQTSDVLISNENKNITSTVGYDVVTQIEFNKITTSSIPTQQSDVKVATENPNLISTNTYETKPPLFDITTTPLTPTQPLDVQNSNQTLNFTSTAGYPTKPKATTPLIPTQPSSAQTSPENPNLTSTVGYPVVTIASTLSVPTQPSSAQTSPENPNLTSTVGYPVVTIATTPLIPTYANLTSTIEYPPLVQGVLPRIILAVFLNLYLSSNIASYCSLLKTTGFHKHFTSSFCIRKSQKHKKDRQNCQSFLRFWDLQARKMFVEYG